MIYFLRHIETRLIKIGHTRQFMKRVANLIAQFGEVELLGLMDGKFGNEQCIHIRFSHLNCKKRDRWFSDYWGSEWFVCEQDLLDYIKANASLNFPLPFAGEIDEQSSCALLDIDRLNALARGKKKRHPSTRSPYADELERMFPIGKSPKSQFRLR